MPNRMILFLVFTFVFCSDVHSDEPVAVNSVEQIHKIDAEQLRVGVPVDLECIVMCYEPDWAILFVSDGKNGFYAGNPRNLALKSGDRIRMLGKLNRSRVPVHCTYEPSENGIEFQSPKQVDFDWLQSGHEDSQLVEIEGQLVGLNTDHFQTTLEMRTPTGGRFRGLLNETKIKHEVLQRMIGKKLRLRGVVGARMDDRSRWNGFQIWLLDEHCILELESPGQRFEMPYTSIADLASDSINDATTCYFRTKGVATYQLAPSMILLQEGNSQVFFELNQPQSLPLDKTYEVRGSLDTSVIPPILRMAEASPLEEKCSFTNQSTHYAVAELTTGDFSGQIVRTSGRFAGRFEMKDQHGFLLQSKEQLLPVFVDEWSFGDIATGTKVDVEGIWIQQKSLVGFNIGSCALHARNNGAQFGMQVPKLMMGLLAAFVFVISVSSIWVVTLRRQVRIKTDQMQSLNAKLTEDLHARTVAEENLRTIARYLEVYRTIVDQHAIVAETDTNGTILSVNDAFCHISGYTREELVGQNHRILNSGFHPSSMWAEMYQTIEAGGIWHGEICNRNKNGGLHWVNTTIAPLFNDHGAIRGYFALRADITSLKEAQGQAEAANRSKSEFLANMSHEIRTPMTAILGYADILAEEKVRGFESEATVDCVETIKRNGEHLLAIINDILDISKIEADKMTAEKIEVAPVRLVQEVVELMQVKSRAKGLDLLAKFDGSIPDLILTDPTRLRQILVNLVGNAIKFTEMGSVTIDVRIDKKKRDLIHFDVIDTGMGIHESKIGSLFRAFEQADSSMTRKFGGTGLGLRISKRLAVMLGGDITVASSLHGGSVFSASIATGYTEGATPDVSQPMWTIPSPHLEKKSNKNTKIAKTSRLDGLRILVVEDGPDNQRLISWILRKAGATVEILENGRLAVERFTLDGTAEGELSKTWEVHLILMDMQMPVMDGYVATTALRSKGLTIPILALTANAMENDRHKCINAGCNCCMTKPIESETLVEACAHWATPALLQS